MAKTKNNETEKNKKKPENKEEEAKVEESSKDKKAKKTEEGGEAGKTKPEKKQKIASDPKEKEEKTTKESEKEKSKSASSGDQKDKTKKKAKEGEKAEESSKEKKAEKTEEAGEAGKTRPEKKQKIASDPKEKEEKTTKESEEEKSKSASNGDQKDKTKKIKVEESSAKSSEKKTAKKTEGDIKSDLKIPPKKTDASQKRKQPSPGEISTTASSGRSDVKRSKLKPEKPEKRGNDRPTGCSPDKKKNKFDDDMDKEAFGWVAGWRGVLAHPFILEVQGLLSCHKCNLIRPRPQPCKELDMVDPPNTTCEADSPSTSPPTTVKRFPERIATMPSLDLIVDTPRQVSPRPHECARHRSRLIHLFCNSSYIYIDRSHCF